MESIGERVKYIRKMYKLNQQQFSTALDISQGRLSEIEKDKCKPSAETLISISTKFNVNLNWLLLGEGAPNKSL
jgi:transcriptional regulator with XRE-family HTH domain